MRAKQVNFMRHGHRQTSLRRLIRTMMKYLLYGKAEGNRISRALRSNQKRVTMLSEQKSVVFPRKALYDYRSADSSDIARQLRWVSVKNGS